ncbi:hypothetical protein [Psychromonas sp. MME2]|uniref:hypothetical protein n=1 Tax=Psychromonas sp. MME2 TaxID=3231033 RepID=UPI00339C4783
MRTKNDQGIDQLQEAGATQVVPEVLEGGLMLVAHVLFLSGIPHRKIIERLDWKGKVNIKIYMAFTTDKIVN